MCILSVQIWCCYRFLFCCWLFFFNWFQCIAAIFTQAQLAQNHNNNYKKTQTHRKPSNTHLYTQFYTHINKKRYEKNVYRAYALFHSLFFCIVVTFRFIFFFVVSCPMFDQHAFLWEYFLHSFASFCSFRWVDQRKKSPLFGLFFIFPEV